MFEKEAEEYAKQNNPAEYGVKATHFTVLNSFKDGAEFGYKEQLAKAKELIKKLLDVAKFYNHYRDKGAVMDITPIYEAEQFLKEVEV